MTDSLNINYYSACVCGSVWEGVACTYTHTCAIGGLWVSSINLSLKPIDRIFYLTSEL